MKFLLIGSLTFLTIVSVVVDSSYAKIRPDTIVGLWLFDEGRGNIVKDASAVKSPGKAATTWGRLK